MMAIGIRIWAMVLDREYFIIMLIILVIGKMANLMVMVILLMNIKTSILVIGLETLKKV